MSIRTVDKSFIKVVKRLYNRRRPIAGKVSGMPRISLNISYLISHELGALLGPSSDLPESHSLPFLGPHGYDVEEQDLHANWQ
jgi:hypothetical protein